MSPLEKDRKNKHAVDFGSSYCISIAARHLSRQRISLFLKNIKTGNKSLFYVNLQRKEQLIVEEKSPQPISKAEYHGRKVLFCVWWDLPKNQPSQFVTDCRQVKTLNFEYNDPVNICGWIRFINH